MSDGMPELQNEVHEMFGYERVKSEFRSVGRKAPGQIIDHLKDAASQWSNGKQLVDDLTFVAIKNIENISLASA